MEYGMQVWGMECGLGNSENGLWTVDCRLWTMRCGIWIMDYRPWSMNYGLWIVDQNWRAANRRAVGVGRVECRSMEYGLRIMKYAIRVWSMEKGGRSWKYAEWIMDCMSMDYGNGVDSREYGLWSMDCGL